MKVNSNINININLSEWDIKKIIANHVNNTLNLLDKISPGCVCLRSSRASEFGEDEITARIDCTFKGDLE